MATQFPPSVALAARRLIALALAEDLGTWGDRTSASTIPEKKKGKANFVVRKTGTICGLPVASMVGAAVDAQLSFVSKLDDGTTVEAGTVIGSFEGPLRSLLSAERTALNFLQRLSGISTATRPYVQAVAGTKAKVLDTRKTTPGWRMLEKYAVACGGGTNHRVGLFDGILIKDNHVAGLGGGPEAVAKAVKAAKADPKNSGLMIEVEVENLEQLRAALATAPDVVLLDNMSNALLVQAVAMRDQVASKILLEASGGVTMANIRSVAETGVDRISVGAITHSAIALDIALDYV